MRGKLIITAAAMLLAGTFATAAQQTQPNEPKGEDSSRSSTPNSQLPGPDQTRGQGGMTQRGKSSSGQSTPQEPKGEESSQSATPRGEQSGPRR
jgi:hypothetical protein